MMNDGMFNCAQWVARLNPPSGACDFGKRKCLLFIHRISIYNPNLTID